MTYQKFHHLIATEMRMAQVYQPVMLIFYINPKG